MTKLTDLDRQIIQQCILDRWNPHRLNRKIAHHFGLTLNQVRLSRRKPAFKQEYARQMAIYQGAFDEVQMADRKERVKAMDALFHKIPDYRVVETRAFWSPFTCASPSGNKSEFISNKGTIWLYIIPANIFI